jgi:hypothetical protein
MYRNRIRHAPNETIGHTPKRVHFFFLVGGEKGGGGREEGDRCEDGLFSFLCSHSVPYVLNDVSHVPNGFPRCSLRVFPIAPHFIPYSLLKVFTLLPYIGEPKGRHSILT